MTIGRASPDSRRESSCGAACNYKVQAGRIIVITILGPRALTTAWHCNYGPLLKCTVLFLLERNTTAGRVRCVRDTARRLITILSTLLKLPVNILQSAARRRGGALFFSFFFLHILITARSCINVRRCDHSRLRQCSGMH